MKDIIASKIIWAATITLGGAVFSLSDDEWRYFLATTAGLVTAMAGGCLKWHLASMKKRRRLNGEHGKGEEDEGKETDV